MLDDFTKSNGSTLLRPKSHLFGTNPTYERIKYYGNYSDQINCQSLAGSVLIMDSKIWHASDVNKTNKRRVGLVVRYAPWWLNLEVFKPLSHDRKKLVEDKKIFGSLYPLISKESFNKIHEKAKPLFSHWTE